MERLSLRLRVFLFFCLSGLGSLCVTLFALWLGFRQLDQPDALSAFVTSAIVSAFGLPGLAVFIWLLFDENISKPIEALAASLRVRAHTKATMPINAPSAKYLGDLAPAVAAIQSSLDKNSSLPSEDTQQHLAHLNVQRDQLVEILSDIPLATILANSDHQIVLYDGQAAALMERVGAARLKGSVFDYLEKASILKALAQMDSLNTSRHEIAVTAHCGRVYAGHIRRFASQSGYTLMLEALAPQASRPLTYDFSLLTCGTGSELLETSLRELTYVVFDTETTGLDPETDEVVQLAAVRVVNGKLVAGEVFDTLVNPGIPIPARSTNVHGIDNSMVADAPAFKDVCTRFHQFAKDAVLIAHNAPFDMAFLHRQSESMSHTFDNPLMDTVLMSAVIFGGSAVHTLDGLCSRLGVNIPEDQRHTALGDATATARALVAMIDILEGCEIKTFGDLKREVRIHSRILQI